MLIGLLLLGGLLFVTQSGRAATCTPYPSEHQRFGFNVAVDYGKTIDDYAVEDLNAGIYLDYQSRINPSHPVGLSYLQMVRSVNLNTITSTLGSKVDANLGAAWIIGNEPDRADFQDDQTPAAYAQLYHRLYHFIKGRDPSAQIAIAAIVQSTPIRRHYLDLVLQAYQDLYGSAMPVDVWTVHGFILCETCAWGADIPPDMDAFAHEAVTYEVFEHDDIAIFQQNLIDFRQWMADRGYRDRPLLLTEYGILFPPDLGFDENVVKAFMSASFDFLRQTTDNEIGYPADGNRLVQAWLWYSLNDKPYDPDTEIGFNGHLFDHDSGVLTAVGEHFSAYTAQHVQPSVDLVATQLRATPYALLDTRLLDGSLSNSSLTSINPITLTLQVANHGATGATNVRARFWYGHPDAGGVEIGSSEALAVLWPGCAESATLEYQWQAPNLDAGFQFIYARLEYDNQELETDLQDNQISLPFLSAQRAYLPMLTR